MYKCILSMLLIKFTMGCALPPPPLTAPLLEVYAVNEVSEEVLINSTEGFSPTTSIRWLDNERIVYDMGGNIETINTTDHSRTFLTQGSYPEVSPDGQWIAFIEKNDDVNQLWLIKSDGSQKREISHVKGTLLGHYGYNYGLAWSPDSSRLAIFINPPRPVEILATIDPFSLSTVQILDLKTDDLREIYSDPEFLGDLSWYPDSKKLLMTKMRIGHLFNEDADLSLVQSLSLEDGSVSILKSFNGLQQRLKPKLSPNGAEVSLLYNAENDLQSWMPSLGVIKSDAINDGSPIKQLTFDLKITHSRWSNDGQTHFVLRNYAAYNQIYTVDNHTGEITQITSAPLNIDSFLLSPDGSKLAWRGMDAHGSIIVRTANSDGSNAKELVVHPGYKEAVALSQVREVEWDTVNYPSKMRGLLLLPNNFKEGVRYPLVVDIHGGGPGARIYLAGGILSDSSLEWQLWTKRGYAVFVPEFRSSAAFGFLAILRDALQEHDDINCDMLDVISGVDELIKQGIADNDRMVAIGYSAGGRRANWLTVSSNRFKAIVSKEGWAWDSFGGSPLEAPEKYLKNSALHHAKNGTTPTLFLMGNPKLGGIDPYNTVHQLYEALKENGIETEYVEYLDEGHSFLLPKNRKDALDRTIDWIDRHIARETT